MRGYGQTDKPEAIDQYTLLHLTGDMVGLVEALGFKEAVIVGHDWGAPVAWHSALFRPDKFKGVVGLSVPFRPRLDVAPTTLMPQTDDAIFYQLYFQEPGVAEAEFERDPKRTISMALLGLSGNSMPGTGAVGMVPRNGGWLDAIAPLVGKLPAEITEDNIDFYANEYKRTGFRGGLNWYRNADRNWSLLVPWAGAKVTIPALYVAGDRDLVIRFPGADKLIANLGQFVPQLRKTIMLPDCGHWTQQERPEEVNIALVRFLKELN